MNKRRVEGVFRVRPVSDFHASWTDWSQQTCFKRNGRQFKCACVVDLLSDGTKVDAILSPGSLSIEHSSFHFYAMNISNWNPIYQRTEFQMKPASPNLLWLCCPPGLSVAYSFIEMQPCRRIPLLPDYIVSERLKLIWVHPKFELIVTDAVGTAANGNSTWTCLRNSNFLS